MQKEREEQRKKEAEERARQEAEDQARWENESELERIEEELKKLEDDAKDIGYEFEQDIQEEIPSFKDMEKEYDELGGITWSNLWEWFIYFRWVINALFTGLPFSIFLGLASAWNIVLNIHFNKWWAGGNVYLVLNTVYSFI